SAWRTVCERVLFFNFDFQKKTTHSTSKIQLKGRRCCSATSRPWPDHRSCGLVWGVETSAITPRRILAFKTWNNNNCPPLSQFRTGCVSRIQDQDVRPDLLARRPPQFGGSLHRGRTSIPATTAARSVPSCFI